MFNGKIEFNHLYQEQLQISAQRCRSSGTQWSQARSHIVTPSLASQRS